MLLFADESEALTHPYLARAWARRGTDLRIPAPGQASRIAIMGALDYAANRLTVTTSRTRRSSDFIDSPAELDRLFAPAPGRPEKPVVPVLDNGPVHTGKLTRTALEERDHWLTVEWLPEYAPELNDIEPAWKALKATEPAHQTFSDIDDLENTIHHSVKNRNSERKDHPWDKSRISA